MKWNVISENILDTWPICILTVLLKEPKKYFNSHAKGTSRIWIRKQDKPNVEECSISLKYQRRRSDFYVDSGCSKHMTGDKTIFITLKKERDGSRLEMKTQPKVQGKAQSSLEVRMQRQRMSFLLKT